MLSFKADNMLKRILSYLFTLLFLPALALAQTVEVLVVAGGGAGSLTAAGGGAGGLLYDAAHSVSAGPYTVTVGNGGTASPLANGGNSVFNSLTAIGGGAGGDCIIGPFTGGSGGAGGNCGDGQAGAAGTSGQGFAGGGGYGGGGGGAGAVGAADSPGTGGVGLQYSINGTATYYAGGGGGGSYAYGTAGGLGGGGAMGSNVAAGGNGTVNTGGGGGGSDGVANSAGGSGIVIIAYSGAQNATGGTISTSSRPGYTVHTFTSSGTFTWGASEPTATPTSTATETPTATPTDTPTVTPTATPTSAVADDTILVFAGSISPSTSSTQYYPISGATGSNFTVETDVSLPVPIAGNVTQLRLDLATAPNPGTYTYTLMKNGVATSLTCAVSGSGQTCNDTTSVSVAAGDLLSVRGVPSSSPGTVTNGIRGTLVFTSNVANWLITAAF
jgi:hypothetical protein